MPLSPSPRIGFHVSRLARLMQARFEAGLEGTELTRLGATLLLGIEEDGQSSPSKLAEYLGITRPALSRLLRRLEAQGYVQLRVASDDGRARHVHLTERGVASLDQIRQASFALHSHFAAKLSNEELSDFKRLMLILLKDEPELSEF